MNKLEKTIIDLKNLNDEYKLSQEEYRIKKDNYESEIRKILGKKDLRTHDFQNDNFSYKATIVDNKKIDFNVEMIEQILDKEVLDEILIKKYEITDYDGLIKYLKTLGANPKIFKQYIHCDKKIDKDKLNHCSELGFVSLDDLEGCYNISITSGYVRITETELEVEDEE